MYTKLTPNMQADSVIGDNWIKGQLLNKWTLNERATRLVVTDVDGTLTDGSVIYGDKGKRFRQFSVIDGYGFELLTKNGFDVLIISGEDDDCIKYRAQKLGVDYALGIKNKATWTKEWYGHYKELYVIGDDVNDLELMKLENVVLAATPKDSILSKMDLPIIDLDKKGGEGAFREFAEIVLSSNQILP